MNFKEKILEILKKETKVDVKDLAIPPDPSMGDYAFPCFDLAKEMKKAPVEIAKELAEKIKPSDVVSKVAANGPFLNFFVNKEKLIKDVLGVVNVLHESMDIPSRLKEDLYE